MRVVIAEDEVLLREGLHALTSRAGHEVMAAVGDAESLVTAAREHHPDLILTDIRMPPTHTDDGLKALHVILNDRPQTAVVVLSQHVNREYALELVGAASAGVGYLLKHRIADFEEFLSALDRVSRGETVIDPQLVTAMLHSSGRRDPLALLTDRQSEVLGLMAEGFSNAAIASRLHVTDKAVVRHVSNVYDALGLDAGPDSHRRVQAVLEYLADVG
jgi:DNA-binding NarL/FixJ family response regulator